MMKEIMQRNPAQTEKERKEVPGVKSGGRYDDSTFEKYFL